jgi:hypothetical protein
MFILVFFERIRAVLVVFLWCICAVLVLFSCCSRAVLALFSCCSRALLVFVSIEQGKRPSRTDGRLSVPIYTRFDHVGALRVVGF